MRNRTSWISEPCRRPGGFARADGRSLMCRFPYEFYVVLPCTRVQNLNISRSGVHDDCVDCILMAYWERLVRIAPLMLLKHDSAQKYSVTLWSSLSSAILLFASAPGAFGEFGGSNTGNFNISSPGNFNTGINESGFGNTGNVNTGNFNTGNLNTGSSNPGTSNTGNFNTGSFNTGSFNTGSFNTGAFNTGNLNPIMISAPVAPVMTPSAVSPAAPIPTMGAGSPSMSAPNMGGFNQSGNFSPLGGTISPLDVERSYMSSGVRHFAPGSANARAYPNVSIKSADKRALERVQTSSLIEPLMVGLEWTLYRADSSGIVKTPFGSVYAEPGALFAIAKPNDGIRLLSVTALSLKVVTDSGECLALGPGTEVFISSSPSSAPFSTGSVARRSSVHTSKLGPLYAYSTRFSITSLLRHPDFATAAAPTAPTSQNKAYKDILKMALVASYLYGSGGFVKPLPPATQGKTISQLPGVVNTPAE